ncbi:MAG: hypothetical protein JXB85_00210 [Anaerolineales bacterium]|nr:hypothetical protein [Anaerolineales bacterium]
MEILRQKQDLYQEIAQELDALWDDQSSLENILNTIQQSVAQENDQRKRHQARTDRLIHHLFQDLEQKNEIAKSWLAATGNLSAFIHDQYDHDRFAPGEYSRIMRMLDQAHENLALGLPEAALLSAQQAYLNLSDFHLELEQLATEWQTMYHLAYHVARELYETVKENGVCAALDMNGNELPFSLQLNFWSNGDYAGVLLRLREILGRLRNEISSISSKELYQLLQEDLPGLKEAFNTIVYQARHAAINSQLRINIADCALQALVRQGFFQETHGYLQNDKRDSYVLSMIDIAGNRVTIQVNPLEDTVSDLVVISEDRAMKTEHEKKKRAQEISAALLGYGLQVGSFLTSPRSAAQESAPIARKLPPARQTTLTQGSQHDRKTP